MAGYIGSKAAVVSSGAERKKTFDITGTTTSLTGLSYTPTFVHLFHNGVRLVDGTDFTATNGSSITLTSAAESGDEVVVISYATFQAADAYTKAEADAEFVSKDGDTITTAAGTALTLDRTGSNGTILDLKKDGTTVGSLGTFGGRVYLADDSQGGISFSSGAKTLFSTNNVGSVEDNAMDIGSSSYRFKDLYLSGGVFLGGAGSANKLSSYETGTWTPTLTFNAANPTGLTYNSITSGTYTKVGRKVTVFGRVMLTSKGTGGSGGLHVSSLPFVPGPQWSGLQIGFIRNTSTGLYQKNLYFTVDPSNTNSPFRFLDSSGWFGSVGWVDINNTFDVIFSGSYEV